MVNPAQPFARGFLRLNSTMLLALGTVVSAVDAVTLFNAAKWDGVLRIDQGVGLLNNYGLISTLVGNALFFYLAKKYYQGVGSIRKSRALISPETIEPPLSKLKAMVGMERHYVLLLFGFMAVGLIMWLSNFSHVVTDPEVRWGHKVFDSPDHPFSFAASCAHNLYTWIVVFSFLAHVVICSSLQLWQTIMTATGEGAMRYDLLNPDQRGGFGFIDRAHIAFNVILAIVYVQITLHVETFSRMNGEHIFGYIALTILLILINRLFLGSIYAAIGNLREQALNDLKERVFEDDKLSFDVLKYCYERRVTAASIVNFMINPGAILISGAAKLWPIISKVFIRVS